MPLIIRRLNIPGISPFHPREGNAEIEFRAHICLTSSNSIRIESILIDERNREERVLVDDVATQLESNQFTTATAEDDHVKLSRALLRLFQAWEHCFGGKHFGMMAVVDFLQLQPSLIINQ